MLGNVNETHCASSVEIVTKFKIHGITNIAIDVD